MTAIFLAVFAVGFVTMGISMIVHLDQGTAGGSRARRRDERKASPVLFLLTSVLTLLVIATLV